jgi:hypothetical protein
MLKLSKRFHGCNEDCLNCPYPDCYKPVSQMKKSIREMTNLPRCDKEGGESQNKMYTLELGGHSRNFY